VKDNNPSGMEQVAHDGLPPSGFIRLPEVLSRIPVSRSTWWKGVAEGRFPMPSKRFGPRVAAWDVRDIRTLIESAA